MGIEKPRHPSPPPPPPVVETSASLVLGNDDLLREILLRVGLATSLIQGALVCRRWCRHASDPAFLRRFRARHPPRILGVYLTLALGPGPGPPPRPRFVPIRPIPELAGAARRAGAFFDAFEGSSGSILDSSGGDFFDPFEGSSGSILDSRGGRLLVSAFDERHESTQFVCSPMCPGRDMVVLPPPPPLPPFHLTSDEECIMYHYGEFLPDGAGQSYFSVVMGNSEQQTTVHLYELHDMSWDLRASAAAQLPVSPPKSRVKLFDNTKFYRLSTINKILVCDFPSSSISTMELPNGVKNEHNGSIMLSRGDKSGIYLVYVKDSQLSIFHCSTAGDNLGNWFLVDTICLRDVCANVGMKACLPRLDGQSNGVYICAVGDNANFVILEMFGAIIFLDMLSKQAEKVYEMTPEDKELVSVRPLMTIWPPVFPMRNEGYDQND
ncbi:hypothetical protein QOZ80_2AG0110130 [Eleusine coracana subsp. coracana]|nr:hypothetical protein QOZ80_2AG0110130 [Eleusine coracana subsp. coracana]